MAVHQFRHLLAQDVIHRQTHPPCYRQIETDSGRRVKGVRIVLIKRKFRGQAFKIPGDRPQAALVEQAAYRHDARADLPLEIDILGEVFRQFVIGVVAVVHQLGDVGQHIPGGAAVGGDGGILPDLQRGEIQHHRR